ncbi:hypothetical protein MtrunA17_Chr2g0293171 [Medicago truncatula]|uniref:Uncharacterized protein n=1 Tax=Medicago truncatula TaxID=3880 RepID=A0A396J8M4_MEDTR|nr:hypothetical protein MtrunA17_Chr2g0293171 [Medicago truncatula]
MILINSYFTIVTHGVDLRFTRPKPALVKKVQDANLSNLPIHK